MPARTAHPTRGGAATRAVEAALLHDLPLVPAIARDLPMGGVPRAGYLAQHCYVLCEALARELEYRSQRERPSHTREADAEATGDEIVARQAEVTAAMDGVLRRLERLYSADRPGGLDHIDDHLSRLNRAVKAYFRSDRSDRPAPHDEDDPWWQGMTIRQRARIVAWASASVEDPRPPILHIQPLPVRVLVVVHYRPQALRRLRNLGLGRQPTKSS